MARSSRPSGGWVTGSANPVGDLTIEQVRRIYEGSVTNWSEVGGPRAKITTITREAGSGTRGAFEELVMEQGKKKIAPSALVQDSTGAVRQMVSQDPTSIGYISLGLVDRSIKPLKLAGVEGSEANMVTGNSVQLPSSPLDSVRTLTANIALEMAYAAGDHRSALFATGIVLFVIIMALNASANLARGWQKRKAVTRPPITKATAADLAKAAKTVNGPGSC